MRKYQSIFFDLDGTIIQSEFGIIESVLYALEAMGVREENPENLKRFIGPPLFDSFRGFYGFSDEAAEEAVKHYREHYSREGLFKAPLYAGIKDTIEALAGEGRKLFVVTGKPTVFASRIIGHHGLASCFAGIVGTEFSDKEASKKDLIEKAMGLSGQPDYIMVGDRCFDIDGAREAGIASIGALYGYGSREELEKSGATYLAAAPEEILQILRE